MPGEWALTTTKWSIESRVFIKTLYKWRIKVRVWITGESTFLWLWTVVACRWFQYPRIHGLYPNLLRQNLCMSLPFAHLEEKQINKRVSFSVWKQLCRDRKFTIKSLLCIYQAWWDNKKCMFCRGEGEEGQNSRKHTTISFNPEKLHLFWWHRKQKDHVPEKDLVEIGKFVWGMFCG